MVDHLANFWKMIETAFFWKSFVASFYDYNSENLEVNHYEKVKQYHEVYKKIRCVKLMITNSQVRHIFDMKQVLYLEMGVLKFCEI